MCLFLCFCVSVGDLSAGGGGDGGGELAGCSVADASRNHEQVTSSGGGKRPALPTVHGRDHC